MLSFPRARHTKFIILLSLLSFLASCGPTTYIFVETASRPSTPIPQASATLEEVPVVTTEAPAITMTVVPDTTPPAAELRVTANVDPVCRNNRLERVNVNLRVSGGDLPYFLDGTEIDPSKPVLTLASGQEKHFTISSSDGQAVPVRIRAPSSCSDANPKDDDPLADPTAVVSKPSMDATAVPVTDPPSESLPNPATEPPKDPPTEIPPVVIIDPPFKFQCNDGQDNDSDGLIDQDDPQCKNKPDNDENG